MSRYQRVGEVVGYNGSRMLADVEVGRDVKR